MTLVRSRAQDGAVNSTRAKLSAFVIAYNRQETIGTCLRALGFADEVIVIDKGSTDATAAIAASLADRVISVPWTPTVEETRAFAAEQCSHEWVLFLDDDECLSAEAARFIDAELVAPRADIYRLPQRHYIMGLHDERAYYWPETQIRWFRRGSVAFTDTVHGGTRLLSDRVHVIAPDDGACIHHLSHRDVAQFIEKANRYTSQPDRKRVMQAGSGIARFAHDRIDHWVSLTDACGPDAYPVAVAILRAVYDLIDRLKTWEEEAGLDGAALFRAECARLEAAHAIDMPGPARPRAGGTETAMIATKSPTAAETAVLRRAVLALHDSVQAQRDAVDAARVELEAARLREIEQRERAAEMQRWAESNARQADDFEAQLGAFSRHHEAVLAEHAAATAERAGANDEARAAWQQERTAWQADCATWEAERAAWQTERAASEAQRAAWQDERATWDTERLAWSEERSAWDAERLDRDAARTAWEAESAAWRVERAASEVAHEAWQAERAAWLSERESWQIEHAERTAELVTRSAQLTQATARAEAAEHRHRSLETSTCWRMTWLPRAVLTRLRGR